MNREKPGPGPWPSRRRSSNSPSPRPDLLKVSSSQSSLARSAPNSPRIKPAKGEREATASPVSKAKSTTRANSNPPELDLNDRELGAELRSRLSGHPGHARRNSSTHRVLETLDAKHHANEKGQRMVNQYALGPLIGRGAYGNVEKGIDVGTGQEYAIKEFSKSRLKRQQQLSSASRIRKPKFEEDSANQGSDDRGTSKAKGNVKGKGKGKDDDEDPLALIRREIAVMKKLDHPNLVLLYEAINVNTSDSLYLVLEYVPGGTLMDIKVGGKPSKSLDKEKARSYFRQLTLGLEYLHSAGVTHRDIKPDNVLLSADRTQVKLCDFGVSEMFTAGDDRMKKSGGSPAFMSPEAAILTQGDVHAKPVDIWAMGVTLYCMLRGSLPFEADNPLDLFEAIKEQEPHIPPEWDDDVKDLVSRMLKKDPDERMVIEEMREHPWVTKNGEDPMPTTDQNLYEIGKQVEEPSEEEVGNAISTFRASL
ncbi:kinase-like domain-containing protein [Filobasidium floriforme]|uniref:kinase-like domain-containing protein n=1 Tax=Filobasidium floriforme TaxID=5210 RepID=UPI001E8D829C|nr:kinase-like domain-containing protein [Filobasidium floriforme]KAH8090390.1 kinase-like domain-containing protein [Filobasidium floriforme]